MAAPQLIIKKAEVIEDTGPVITTEEGERALVMSRESTLAHGFVFVAPAGHDFNSDFWEQFHVDLRDEPYSMVTGFGEADYRFATRDPTVLAIAREWVRVFHEVQPPPQQIELDPVRIKSK